MEITHNVRTSDASFVRRIVFSTMRTVVILVLACNVLTAFAQADLALTSTATPNSGLAVGSEFLVGLQVTNLGPNAAESVSVGCSAPGQMIFLEIVAIETPSCVIEQLEFNPPLFNFFWQAGSLQVASTSSCNVRLRVRVMPDTHRPILTCNVRADTADPLQANNTQQIQLIFAQAGSVVVPVPTLSIFFALGLIFILATASLRALRRG